MTDNSSPVLGDDRTWIVTFGLGSLNAGRYTEIVVPAGLAETQADELVRFVAADLYGTAWAFSYTPKTAKAVVDRWDLKLRERIEVDADARRVSR